MFCYVPLQKGIHMQKRNTLSQKAVFIVKINSFKHFHCEIWALVNRWGGKTHKLSTVTVILRVYPNFIIMYFFVVLYCYLSSWRRTYWSFCFVYDPSSNGLHSKQCFIARLGNVRWWQKKAIASAVLKLKRERVLDAKIVRPVIRAPGSQVCRRVRPMHQYFESVKWAWM